MEKSLITIGESLHASIPKAGAMMKELAGFGVGAYSRPSEALDYIKGLIESQVSDGADYIAVNVDAFGETEPQVAVDLMAGAPARDVPSIWDCSRNCGFPTEFRSSIGPMEDMSESRI